MLCHADGEGRGVPRGIELVRANEELEESFLGGAIGVRLGEVLPGKSAVNGPKDVEDGSEGLAIAACKRRQAFLQTATSRGLHAFYVSSNRRPRRRRNRQR